LLRVQYRAYFNDSADLVIDGVTAVDHLCDLVVRVPGYSTRGPGFDFRPYQIF
jgi:hypothetical protein